MGNNDFGNINSMGNLSYMNFSDGNGIILATFGTTSSNSAGIYLNLTEKPKQISFQFNNDMMKTFSLGNYKDYYINVSGQTFVIASDVSPAVNGNNMSFSSAGLIYVVIFNDQSLMNEMNIYDHYANGFRFHYNSATGNVSGRYASFNFYKDNGTISSFYDNISQMTVFNNITMKGNGNLPSIMITQSPIVGNMFYYGNSTYAFAVHDNPALQSSFVINNGTMTINVSSSLTMINKTYMVNFGGMQSAVMNGNILNATMGFNQQIRAGTTFVYLNGTDFYGMLNIQGGEVSISGHEITIKTNGTAIISFVAPPGLQKIYRGFGAMQYAMDRGKLGLQMSIENVNSTITNYTVYLNNSINAIVKSAQNGKVVININSSEPTGTVVAIFVSNSVIKNTTAMSVKFDSSFAIKTTAADLVNETSTTTAYYNVTSTENGSVIMIYIPHFSDHVLEIEPYTAPVSYNIYY